MYDGDGKPKAYSQLAAIQFGWLLKSGAVVWRAKEKAANGAEEGCFDVALGKKWQVSVDQLTELVLRAKATGDKKAAEKLKAEFVDDKREWKRARDVVTERWLMAPKATFVFGVTF
jgi:hypothetical protein